MCLSLSVLCDPHMKLSSLSLISMKSLLGFQWAWRTYSDYVRYKGSQQKADTVKCAHMYSVYVGFEPLISWLRLAYHIDQCPLDSNTGRE